jgi:hypothetical protein
VFDRLAVEAAVVVVGEGGSPADGIGLGVADIEHGGGPALVRGGTATAIR